MGGAAARGELDVAVDGDALFVGSTVALHLAIEILEVEKDGIGLAVSIETARQVRRDEERTDVDSERVGVADRLFDAEQVECRARVWRCVGGDGAKGHVNARVWGYEARYCA